MSIIAFFLVVFYVSARFRRRFEQVLPVAMFAAMLVLTGLAMAGTLGMVDVLGIALCALICIAIFGEVVVKRYSPAKLARNLWQYGVTPGTLCFAALAVFFCAAAQPMSVWWRDDLAHWGLQVKSLWYANGLVDGEHLLNIRFGDYPPGVQVLQWWAMHTQGAWGEPALYSTLFLSYAALLLPLFDRLTWKKWYLLPLVFVFCVVFPAWGNVLSYVFLGIDTTLSLCFGYVLVLIWRHAKGDRLNLLAIALGLCGLVLIKQIGLLLALMAIVLFAIRKADRGAKTLVVYALPAAVFIAWYLYCKGMGLHGYNSSGAFGKVASFFQGTYQLPENASGIFPALWNALITRYSGDITFMTTAPLLLPLLFWLIALPAAPLLLAGGNAYRWKEMRPISLYIAISSLVFLLAIYLSFFTTFYYETNVYTFDQQENMVLLVERYLAPLLLGHGMLVLTLFLGALSEGRLRLAKPLPLITVSLATLLFALSTNWAVMAEVLNPDVYFQNERSVGSEATVRDQEQWGSALDGVADARVMLDLDSTSDYVKELCYTFAPARFYLSTTENTLSTETLTAYLLQNGITHLICLQDGSALQEAAAPLAADGEFYSYTLYDVTVADGQVTLEENLN